MPPAQRESLDIEGLLGELHRKKRWLDTVIEGLEQSVQSPELRFVEAVQAVFEDRQTPRADIPAESPSLLRLVAAQIPRRDSAMETRRTVLEAPESA